MAAPSLVEATLGRTVSAPTAAESEIARGLVARMVAEGSVLPLNLLGGPGDVPDFVVSAQVFGFVFTLRGDKNWKQPPSTSGAVKVSPLALKVYEVLAPGTAMTAAELVGELGREVTENAISRALVELWGQMRVIPVLQQDGAAAIWELTSRRFTKPMKAGANAGQPTALSALISAYLAQVFAASEDEIQTFLSPLSARSRVRDALHGLTAARQLENVVLDGKTLLYIPGALPEFPEIAAAEPVGGVGEIAAAALGAVAGVVGAIAGAARIRKFDGPRSPRPPREDRGERPFRKTGGERGRPRKPFGERKPYGRAGGQSEGRGSADRERRPFQRDRAQRGGAQGERKSFTRPWDEDRKPRPRREEGEAGEGARPFRKEGERTGGEFRGKPAFGRKPAFGKGPKRDFVARPRRTESVRSQGGERPFRPTREGGAGERPFRPRREGAGEERPFRARSEAGRGERPFRARREDSAGERPFRPKRESGDEKRPFRARSKAGGGEPPRGRREDSAGERPFRPKREGGDEKRPFRARPEGSGGERPFRARREGSAGERPFRPRSEGDREGGGARPAKPFRRREEGAGGRGAKAAISFSRRWRAFASRW